MQEYTQQQAVKESPPPGRRRGSFRDAESLEAACSHVRGVLIARLDDVFDKRVRPLLLAARVAEWECTPLFQEIQLAMFPEEFAEDAEVAETLKQERAGRSCGLVPRPTTGHLNQAGADRLLTFAAKLGAKVARRPSRVGPFTPSLFD